MRCADCGLRRKGAARGCARCAGAAIAFMDGLRDGAASLDGEGPRIIASGKTCPECGEVTYLSRAACAGCGHAYRTIFPSGMAPPPDAGMPPTPSSHEAAASRGVFLAASMLMTALAAGLIFYLVNHY